jgi:hypothetical protein
MTVGWWTCLLLLTTALSWSCGTTDRKCTAFGEAGGASGEAGQAHSAGRLCAPECSVFCGTKQECSLSNGGQGGLAEQIGND